MKSLNMEIKNLIKKYLSFIGSMFLPGLIGSKFLIYYPNKLGLKTLTSSVFLSLGIFHFSRDLPKNRQLPIKF